MAGFGAPGQLRHQGQRMVSPGNYMRNPVPTGGAAPAWQPTPPAGYRFGNHQVGYVDAGGVSRLRPQLLKLPPPKDPNALGGFNAGSPPEWKPPSIGSSIDLNSMMQNFQPESIGKQFDVAQANRLRMAADPSFAAEGMAANQNNQASVMSGQSLDVMRRQMAPQLAQAAMVGAQGPVNRQLDRYGFQTQGLGAQANEVMGQARNQMGSWGDALGDWGDQLDDSYAAWNDKNNLIRLMLG